jgi:hypothetical protein
MFRNIVGHVFVVLGVPVGGNGRGLGGNRFVGVVHRQSK